MGYFEEILERSQSLGGDVDKLMAEARSYLSRADELNKQLEQARRAEEAEYAAHVESVASTGNLPTLNGWGRWVFDSPSSKLVVASVALCHTKASAAARGAGPRIFEALQRRVAGVVNESAKLASTVPAGVVDEMTALRAGPEHHTTWTRLRSAVDAWTQAFELLAVMQRAGWVDGPSHPQDHDRAVIFQRYLRPLSLPPGYWKGPGELRLAKAAASNAEPGLYSWQSALERFERIDRRQRNYVSGQTITRRDGLGNIVAEERSEERPAEFVRTAR